MLLEIHPKLPMRDKQVTRDFYVQKLGFKDIGAMDYDGYLILRKDEIEIHFFEYKDLDPLQNYGQIYIRTNDAQHWYQRALDNNITIPQAGHLKIKPWGQKEFAMLDPDHNLLTFGESIK